MLKRLSLIRNIGQFDNVNDGKDLDFAGTTVLYAENGRGKTTIASIFRAAADVTSVPVDERRRLGSNHTPHIVLETDDGQPAAVLQNGAWSRPVGNIRIFDDAFVDANVYSGLAVESTHRKNLHDVVIGSTAVAIARELQVFIDEIPEHNKRLRELGAAQTPAMRGSLSPDEYVALKPIPKIDELVTAAEQALNAARDSQAVEAAPVFEQIHIPGFDLPKISGLLAQDLPGLDEATVAHVNARFDTLTEDGERWVGEGIRQIAHRRDSSGSDACPLCEQDLAKSQSIDEYRHYFSGAYERLKADIATLLAELDDSHGDRARADLERAARVTAERVTYWQKYIEVSPTAVDMERLLAAWRTAATALRALCVAKQRAPLEPLRIPDTVSNLVNEYEAVRAELEAIRIAANENNERILHLRSTLAGADIVKLESDLEMRQIQQQRFTPDAIGACDAYSDETAAKRATEGKRDSKRGELDSHRAAAFPAYEQLTNTYLAKFNAGFRIGSLKSGNTGGGPTCGYSVIINNTQLPVGATGHPGTPSFRTALSAGDRNTLALAFFFASLELDADLKDAVVVIDDPVSSLDEHRSLTTVEEVVRLSGTCAQVIVLSHSKPFLASVWGQSDKDARAALEAVRTATGSGLRGWDVTEDLVTEHDRRAKRLKEFDRDGVGDKRGIARDLRHHLEGYMRVSRPREFPPSRLLGPFLETCRQRLASGDPVLAQADIDELASILEFANKHHHDTNPAYEAEQINDGELQGFVKRVLKFCER